MKILICIMIITGTFRVAYSWAKAYEQVWVLVRPDSSFILTQGEYSKIPTHDVFDKTKSIDSLFGVKKWPRGVFNFHIGKCDKNEELKYQLFPAFNHIRIAAIGCRNDDGKTKVIQIWNPTVIMAETDTDYVFSENEFRRNFEKANADTSYFHQNKINGVNKIIERKL